jgi:hypothetical protein
MNSKKWLILLPSFIIILLASNVGITRSSFVDLESSTGNTFQAWSSTQWLQTTKAHFDAGVLTNVDTSSSPGDVKLAAKSGWYNASWQYRRALTLSAATSVSNYQVLVTLTTAIMGSPYAHVKSDGSDIRFTGPDGFTLQDYWIESWNNTGTSKIWVEVANSGTSSIYMYYGNSGAASASNGTATFEFFDDFSGDLSKWTIDPENTDNKVYISNGSLRHDPDSSQTKNSYYDTRIITKDYKMLNGVIEYEVYLAGTARIIHQLGWRVPSLNFENGYCWRVQTGNGDGGHLRFTGRASWVTFGTVFNDVSANTWHTVKEVVTGSTYTGYVDGGSAYSGTDSTKLTADYLVSHVHGVSLTGSSYVLVDNIRVRKYVATEPTTSVGSEEGMYVLSGTIASQVLDTGVAGAGWNALFWDETLDTGTGITFAVRAANSLAGGFPDAAWIPVGGTSPVTSGLPSGRYMQWQVTLTTSDSSKTPTLSEVRVYY